MPPSGVGDAVLEAVLSLAGRDDLLKAKKLANARGKLEEILVTLDELSGAD